MKFESNLLSNHSEIHTLRSGLDLGCLIKIGRIPQNKFKIVARLDIVWFELQCLVKVRYGLVEPPLTRQGYPKVVMHLHQVGLEL